jgi:predicted metal-dependent peptidase
MGVSVISDGTVDSVYNREFVDSLSNEGLACVIIHEIDHIIRLHCIRKMSRIKECWNIAADAIVNGTKDNPNIKIVGKDYSEKCYLPNSVVWYTAPESNLGTEQYYDWLKKNSTICPTCGAMVIHFDPNAKNDQSKGKGQGQNQKGQGQNQGQNQGQGGGGSQNQDDQGQEKDEHTCPTCGAKPEMVDDHGMWDNSTANEDDARAIVDGMVAQTCKSAGNAPGHLEEAIKALKEVRTNWMREMNEWMGKKCGGRRNTFSRLNRRLPRFGIPGSTSRAMVDLSVFCDTSGSMGPDEISEAFSNIEKLAYRSKIRLIEFDHGIEHVSKYRKGDWKKIKIHGRGGTSIVRALKEAEERGLIGDVNVVITDGYLEWPEQKSYPMLWYVVSSSNQMPTWGKVIKPN